MKRFTEFVTRPYAILIAAGLIVCGVFASSKAPMLGAVRPQSPTYVQPASNTPVSIDGRAPQSLHEQDAEMAALADRTLKSVVQILAAGGNDSAGVSGQGSGFIYRSDGWIVTNDHVVAGFDKVTVILPDGREVEGKVTRANDSQADIAVVKVDEKNLTAMPMADSSQVRPAQIAMAIGSPFGRFANSVTIGHVSAVGRSNQVMDGRFGPRGYSTMIQTDAPINPGNSGGPLVNIDGQVIGITTSIFSNSMGGGNVGIGFALPSNQAKVIADLLINNGKLNRGMMGVVPENLKPFEKQRYGVQLGAIVREVDPGSPAEKAGLKASDVVVGLGGEPVREELDLRLAMYKHAPGTKLGVDYVRDGKKRHVVVTLVEKKEVALNTVPQRNPFEDNPNLPPTFGQPTPGMPSFGVPARGRLGVQVQQIDDTLRRQFEIPSTVNGVVVVGVLSGSLAETYGIGAGDVVLQLDDKKISKPQDLTDAVQGLRAGKQVRVSVRRFKGGVSETTTIEVPFR